MPGARQGPPWRDTGQDQEGVAVAPLDPMWQKPAWLS